MSYVKHVPKHVPGFLSPLNSSKTETKAHLCRFIPSSVLESRLNFEKKEEFAVPHVVHSELKRPVCNARGANEDEEELLPGRMKTKRSC